MIETSRARISMGFFSAIVGCLGLTARAETQLEPPLFIEEVSASSLGEPTEVATGMDMWLPETISVDLQASNGSQAVARVITSAIGPMLDITASASGGTGSTGANGTATITYQMAVERVVPDAPDSPVRIGARVDASASASGEGLSGFDIYIPDPLQILQTTNDLLLIRMRAQSRHGGFEPGDYPPAVNFSHTYEYFLPVETALTVTKEGFAGAGAGPEGQGSDVQVVADPIFFIDPLYMVDYQGVPTPATDLYEIIFSEGIMLPEPGVVTLLSAAAMLGLRRARRND